MPMEIRREKLMSLHVQLGESQVVGDVPEGRLVIIPIVGGTFQGPRLRGSICLGGADWNVATSPTAVHLLARYWLKTDDGHVIAVENEGFWDSARDEGVLRTTPRFQCDKNGPYAFLTTGCYTGELRGGEGQSVDIDLWTLK